MTHIILVSPTRELVVHSIPIFNNSDVKKVQSFIKNKEEDYGELERIIISMGTVRIMEKTDDIPIPLKWGGGWKTSVTERHHDLILCYCNTIMLAVLVLHNYKII